MLIPERNDLYGGINDSINILVNEDWITNRLWTLMISFGILVIHSDQSFFIFGGDIVDDGRTVIL